MENLSTKTPRAFKLIRGLFILLFALMMVAVVCLFVLNINYTVDIKSGEIISKNTPIEYHAPFEARIQSIKVTEGSSVNKGDTLMILDNQEMATAVLKTTNELELVEKNISIYKDLLKNLSSQIQEHNQQQSQIKTNYAFQQKDIQVAIQALKSQLDAQTRKMEISKNKLQQDLVLLRDGIISKLEYDTDHKIFLSDKESYTKMKRQYDQRRNDFAALPNQQSGQVSQQALSVLSGKYDRSQIEQQLTEENIRKVQLADQLQLHRNNLEKTILVAAQDGFVSRLYNVKMDANFIERGAELLVLSPREEASFYAEMLLSQQAVRSVKPGQQTHLKLDAYNYYQYGILKGEVSFIKKDTSNNFFVLAELPALNPNFNLQSGYKVKGEIIIEEVKLYQFIMRKLFHNLEV